MIAKVAIKTPYAAITSSVRSGCVSMMNLTAASRAVNTNIDAPTETRLSSRYVPRAWSIAVLFTLIAHILSIGQVKFAGSDDPAPSQASSANPYVDQEGIPARRR